MKWLEAAGKAHDIDFVDLCRIESISDQARGVIHGNGYTDGISNRMMLHSLVVGNKHCMKMHIREINEPFVVA